MPEEVCTGIIALDDLLILLGSESKGLLGRAALAAS
jgi:hypothetical protein